MLTFRRFDQSLLDYNSRFNEINMSKKFIRYSTGIKSFLVAIVFFALTSCSDFIDVGIPKNQLVAEMVFTTDQTANAAMIGIYSRMMDSPALVSMMLTVAGGVSSDELVNYNTLGSERELFENEITPTNTFNLMMWQSAYEYIYQANMVIEGVTNATGLLPTTKSQLLGEAKFVRAFCHFYLVNLYGPVPIVASSNYEQNAVVSRSNIADVYNFILQDLSEAKQLLPTNYVGAGKGRPNKYAASALLARVYLYRGDDALAEVESTFIIESNAYSLKTNPAEVFLVASAEAIWQLLPVAPSMNTYDADRFVTTAAPITQALNPTLVNSFDEIDARRAAWIGQSTDGVSTYYFPYKYKVKSGATTVTEHYMMFRLAEQYLIRAEVRANQGKLTGAVEDIDLIRNRAGLPSVLEETATPSEEDALNFIVRERQFELFAELGHRWFDLKRWDLAGEVLSGTKPGWDDTDILFPVPDQERQRNINLSQNLGY